MNRMNLPATKLLQKALKDTLGPAIEGMGFEGNKRTYRRPRNGMLDIVDVQLWKYNDVNRAQFTINLGICVPVALERVAALQSFAYVRTAVASPGITECAVWERISVLMPDHTDKWWTVSSGTDPSAVAEKAMANLVEFGMPWLENYPSLEAFARRPVPRPSVYDIALRSHLGLREETRAAFEAYAVQWRNMPERVQEVAQWLEHGQRDPALGPQIRTD
jgi:hypothetical protein